MFRIWLRAAIWLSTNSSRVCTFAFGNSVPSDASSACVFCSDSPPFIRMNV